MALSIGTNGSIQSQANTQSPQTSAGSGSPTSAPGKSVQPGTATDLLSGPGGGSDGTTLNSTILPVANLDASSQMVSQPIQQVAKPQQHHLNPVLLSIIILFIVLAVAFFWRTAHYAKNTTDY